MSLVLMVLAAVLIIFGAFTCSEKHPVYGLLLMIAGSAVGSWLVFANAYGEHEILYNKTFNVQTIETGGGARRDIITVDGQVENLNELLKGVYTGKVIRRTVISQWAGGIYWVDMDRKTGEEASKRYLRYHVVGDQPTEESRYGY